MATDEQQQSTKKPLLFCVGSIERTDSPVENSDAEWYHYIIEHEKTKIEGKRSGTLESVTEHLEEYVEKLNSRAYWGYSSYATRPQKK